MPAALYCALDTPDLGLSLDLARSLTGVVDGLKLGLEFFTVNGPAGVAAIKALGLPIFLDLKLHDIPNTVAGAMRGVARLGVSIVTVHAAGGAAMLRAAAEAAATGNASTRVVGVTVLTSLGAEDLSATGQDADTARQVERLAALSLECGLTGVVASAREAAVLRQRFPSALLVVPGLRPAWAGADDQKRVTTPAEAAADGADVLVIGRPITAAPDPAAAARRILAELSRPVAPVDLTGAHP